MCIYIYMVCGNDPIIGKTYFKSNPKVTTLAVVTLINLKVAK